MIIVIDIVMSGDNAIIIGLAAAGLPLELRKKAILYGIIGATVLRIAFAAAVVQLLAIKGVMLVGGLLLVWVAWRMWRELHSERSVSQIQTGTKNQLEDVNAETPNLEVGNPKTLKTAMINIIVADVSMSLDNVLAVAGAARDHLGILIFGLVLSIGLMGITANYIAKLLERYNWLGFLGLAIIGYVAVDMIWRGGLQIHKELLTLIT